MNRVYWLSVAHLQELTPPEPYFPRKFSASFYYVQFQSFQGLNQQQVNKAKYLASRHIPSSIEDIYFFFLDDFD